jgi:peptide/nickel transport system permease protein
VIRYIVRRLLSSLPVLFGVVALVFIIARVLPGDPCTAMYAEKATKVVCDAFNTRYGLDRPILDQFAIYVGALLQGDLGTSILFGRDISAILIERLPVTVELTFLALLFATIVGVPLGIA